MVQPEYVSQTLVLIEQQKVPDSYVKSVKADNEAAHFRVFALVPIAKEKTEWKEFPSEEARQKAQEAEQAKSEQVFESNAFVYKKDDKITQVNMTYYSASADLVVSQVLFYRPDGTLAKMEESLSFVPESYVSERNIYYVNGKKIGGTRHVYDMETHKEKKIEPMAADEMPFQKLDDLP